MARRKQQIGILIGCIILATTLWGYVTLTRIYENDIEIPLVVVTPPNQALLSTVPNSITIRIRGTGLQIINLEYLNRQTECKLDLTTLNADVSVYTANKDDIIKSVAIPSGIRVTAVNPGELKMSTGDMTGKRVPVELRTNIACRDGFLIVNQPVPEPAFVMVRGTKQVVDAIEKWPTEKLSLADVHGAKTESISVSDSLMTVLNVVPRSVKATLDVQQVSTFEINNVPIEGTSGAIQAKKLFPENVKVIVRTGVEVASSLTPSDFKVSLPLTSSPYARPQVLAPAGVTVVGTDPAFVHVVMSDASP